MTISSTVSRNEYVGDGVTSTYAFSFKILATSDLEVTVLDTDGEEEVLTLGTDYSVSWDEFDASGSITLLEDPLTSGYALTIRRVRPVTQTTDIRNQGDYYPETHENAFDHLVMLCQQQQDEIDRCIQAPVSDTDALENLPAAEDRASKFLAFDADGQPIASDGGINGSITVSAFGETLVDDSNASNALTTLGVSTFAKTILDDTTAGAVLTTLGATPADTFGWFHNISIASATTSATRDSIKITSRTGTALSSSNPGFIWLQSSTVGQIAVFTVTADVTINLTGAHWGLDTLGDFNGVYLRVHAINDSGTLKWGVSLSHHSEIADTDSSATGSSVSTKIKMLVNSALGAGTWNCRQLGYVRANFDDTGGLSENLWQVSSGATDVRTGARVPVNHGWVSFTPTGSWSTNTTYTGKYRRDGEDVIMKVKVSTAGAPTSATLTINFPTGITPDTTAMLVLDADVAKIGDGFVRDNGSATYPVSVTYNSSGMTCLSHDASGTYVVLNALTQAVPITFGANDGVELTIRYPVKIWTGGNP